MNARPRSVYPKHYFAEPNSIRSMGFILMPFRGFDAVHLAIREAIQMEGLEPLRADDEFLTRASLEKILRGIDEAEVVVADMTGRNPNVFYEVGLAHATKENVVLIAQDLSDLPFDLQHVDHLAYDQSPDGLRKLTADLASILRRLSPERPRGSPSGPLTPAAVSRLTASAAAGWEAASRGADLNESIASRAGTRDEMAETAVLTHIQALYPPWRDIDNAGVAAAQEDDQAVIRRLMPAIGWAISHQLRTSNHRVITDLPHVLAIRSWCHWGAIALQNESWSVVDELLNRSIELRLVGETEYAQVPSFDYAMHPRSCEQNSVVLGRVLRAQTPLTQEHFGGDHDRYLLYFGGFMLASSIASFIQGKHEQFPMWAFNAYAIEPLVKRLEVDVEFAAGFVQTAARQDVEAFNRRWTSELGAAVAKYGTDEVRRNITLRVPRLPTLFAS